MALGLWRRFSAKTKRILVIVAFFVLSVIMTTAGILTPLSDEEIDAFGRELEDTQSSVRSMPTTQQVSFIFGNNFMICLVGFVPVIGPIFESYVLYSTGVVITGYSMYKHYQVNPLMLFFSLFLFPFTWLEFLAYSTAMAESFWLFWRVIKRKGKLEIKNTCILVSICAVMLLVGAVIEATLISL